MNRVIGVLNYKGGTGKTTTVVNLGAGLCSRGARVLCIDLDAQGSLATYLGVDSALTITDLLLQQARPQDCINNVRENLDLIASDKDLRKAEAHLYRMDDGLQARRMLAERLQGIDGYDYVILDFSPAGGIISETGLFYVRELIVPVSMDYLALVGVREVIQMLKQLSQIPEYRVRLFLLLPMFYYSRLRKDRQILETLHRHFAGKVATPIRASVKLSEAPSHQLSIYDYAPGSTSAIDYAQLVERVSNGCWGIR
jgi:chromosome partitioning protein